MPTALQKHLKSARFAIDSEFGVGYAIKNPELVAALAELDMQISPAAEPSACQHTLRDVSTSGAIFCKFCNEYV